MSSDDLDILTRFLTNLADRIHGPFMFRFVFQPVMAAWLALHDGIADARAGRASYVWALLAEDKRIQLLREAARRVARVLVLGVVMDVTYQLVMFRWIYPLELVVTVLVVAFLPYLLVRGLVHFAIRLRYLGASPTRRADSVGGTPPRDP